MCLVHARSKLIGELLHAIHNHLVTGAGRPRHSDLAQSISRLVALLHQPRNDPHGGIVLVQGRRELFPGARQLLLQVIRLEG